MFFYLLLKCTDYETSMVLWDIGHHIRMHDRSQDLLLLFTYICFGLRSSGRLICLFYKHPPPPKNVAALIDSKARAAVLDQTPRLD